MISIKSLSAGGCFYTPLWDQETKGVVTTQNCAEACSLLSGVHRLFSHAAFSVFALYPSSRSLTHVAAIDDEPVLSFCFWSVGGSTTPRRCKGQRLSLL
eukprot:890765-Amphidinium_carterae.1